jgi:hypothetical protein
MLREKWLKCSNNDRKEEKREIQKGW